MEVLGTIMIGIILMLIIGFMCDYFEKRNK